MCSLNLVYRLYFQRMIRSKLTITSAAARLISIFCDWTPDLDGMGFVRQIRQADDTPTPYCPIVVVTANTELRHVCYARDNGMTEFLAKPISAKTIYSRLCSVIENPRAFIRVGKFFGLDRRRRQAEGYESSERRRA